MNTPDTEEWEKEFDALEGKHINAYSADDWKKTKDFIASLLTSRDTYWKERVQSLTDYIEHDNQCIISQAHRGRPTNDGGYETQYGDKWYRSPNKPECNCGLDTLLDNLK